MFVSKVWVYLKQIKSGQKHLIKENETNKQTIFLFFLNKVKINNDNNIKDIFFPTYSTK